MSLQSPFSPFLMLMLSTLFVQVVCTVGCFQCHKRIYYFENVRMHTLAHTSDYCPLKSI